MRIFLLFCAMTMISCASEHSTSETTSPTEDSTVKMITIHGKYNVWTKKVGSGNIKLLLLHGGPGFCHDYLVCFTKYLLPTEDASATSTGTDTSTHHLDFSDLEIYYYDQLGCGNSDRPTDTSLYTISRYVEEVEEVRKGLGLDSFYLYGQSWGGMLAMEYLQKYQSHVKAAILSNMTAGMKSYESYAAKLKEELFTKQEQTLYDSLYEAKAYASDAYQNLLTEKLYKQVLCRSDPWPDPLNESFKKFNASIYNQMQGVDEFHITGNFKDWEMWDRLPTIAVPTLVLGARYDEMNPADIRREGQLIPNSRTVICPNGSHLSMYDDPDHYFQAIIAFLKDVSTDRFVADIKQNAIIH